jgi:aryl-alcohol dehydrogenase-like predicted oxidoreductase
MGFGKQVDEATAASMVDLALDRGINFIDTANVYNRGASEEILGHILGRRRDQIVLATKVGIRVGDWPADAGLSAAAIRNHIDQSLSRLRTDYVDLYYLHQPDPTVPLEESLSAMDQLVRAGKVRHVAASNYAAWQVCHMRGLAQSNGWANVVVTQPMYNLLARAIEAEFLPMCRALGVFTAAYNPLAGGFLTGKHKAEKPPEAGTRFDNNQAYQDRYWRAANFDAVARLQAAAGADGRSLISLALGWMLHHTSIDSVILGASNLDQLRTNIDSAADGPCSTATLEVCDSVWTSVRGSAPAYFR